MTSQRSHVQVGADVHFAGGERPGIRRSRNDLGRTAVAKRSTPPAIRTEELKVPVR